MRLLFVHERLGGWGGAEANILLTASRLQSRGHQLGLMYRQIAASQGQAWRDCFTSLFPLPASGATEQAAALIKQWSPDVIYCHNLADLRVFETLLHSGVPVVRMVHDHQMYCLRSYKYNYFTRHICTRPASLFCVFPCLGPLTRNRSGKGLPVQWASYTAKQEEIRLNRQCARLVVFSEYMREELIRNRFDPRRIAIHRPILSGEPSTAVSSFSERNLIVSAGQIIRGKGVDLLLQALARVQVSFECLVFGEGNHRPYCERLCRRLGLESRVRFAGAVSREELGRHCLEASAFALGSVWPEPFGLVGPEAMGYGLPVVAFDAGAIPEWLHDGQNGYLIPWKDTVRFAARLESLLRDKTLARKLGRQGRDHVLQAYDADQQVQALERLFEQITSSAPPDSGELLIAAKDL